MSTHLLLEAAVRSLVMGAMILMALRLLRIDQVRARRTAWLLALIGALAMPVLVGAQIGPRLLPEIAAAKAQPTLYLDGPYIDTAASSPYRDAAAQDEPRINDGRNASAAGARDAQRADGAEGAQSSSIVLTLAVIGYCAVAAVLSLRLCAGVGFALRLRNQAERVVFPFDPELEVRSSSRIATPVTIGSSVLLPSGYVAWDEATLRIVLSHERAHVRQADFYVHALAGLHCALFWFNPFSWWLQRQLSELGEALSDCAAVEQAESRASYAETLLAFATRARWPLTGVAMASASNLTPRIERLLSDKGFERSFAVKHRLPYVAAAVVIMAMVASTSMTRVHASPSNGPLNAVNAAINSNLSDAIAAQVSNSISANMSNSVASNVSTSVAANAAAIADDNAPKATGSTDATAASAAKSAGIDARSAADARAAKNDAKKAKADRSAEHDETGEPVEEGIMAIVTDHSRMMFDTGNMLPHRSGNYIYFQHDGKPYLVQDPAIMAQAQVLLAPMIELRERQQELGLKQRELGTKQSLLGAQQRALAAEQRVAKIDTPEFKREVAELQKMIKQMNLAELTAQIDRNALAEIQSHMGEIQAAAGRLQAEMSMQQGSFGVQQGELGAQQGELGAQQGKLGEQQAVLGEQQRKIVEDVRRQLKPIIEQAIREGKGKALENW
jgi:beta-lactamase regulating signal transducer with metallopeptidase domain